MVKTVPAYFGNKVCYAALNLLKNMALLFLIAAALFSKKYTPRIL